VYCFWRIYAILYVVMQVVELMKTHVVKTTPDATLGEAVDLMDLYQVSSLPVVDTEGVLCGMLSESDVMRALLDSASPLKAFSEAQVTQALRAGDARLHRIADYMTQPAIHISEHADIREAARILLTCGLKRLPVTDEHNRVVGALNRIDVVQAVFEDTL
jgi:CBS domain-containing protein